MRLPALVITRTSYWPSRSRAASLDTRPPREFATRYRRAPLGMKSFSAFTRRLVLSVTGKNVSEEKAEKSKKERGEEVRASLGWPITNRPQVDNLPHNWKCPKSRSELRSDGKLKHAPPRIRYGRLYNATLALVALDHGQSSGVAASPASTGFSSIYATIRWNSFSFLTQRS